MLPCPILIISFQKADTRLSYFSLFFLGQLRFPCNYNSKCLSIWSKDTYGLQLLFDYIACNFDISMGKFWIKNSNWFLIYKSYNYSHFRHIMGDISESISQYFHSRSWSKFDLIPQVRMFQSFYRQSPTIHLI